MSKYLLDDIELQFEPSILYKLTFKEKFKKIFKKK
jgi:hypothetical protein